MNRQFLPDKIHFCLRPSDKSQEEFMAVIWINDNLRRVDEGPSPTGTSWWVIAGWANHRESIVGKERSGRLTGKISVLGLASL